MRKPDKGLIILCIIIGIIWASVYVYMLTVYGGKPLSELPAWVVPFFLNWR